MVLNKVLPCIDKIHMIVYFLFYASRNAQNDTDLQQTFTTVHFLPDVLLSQVPRAFLQA